MDDFFYKREPHVGGGCTFNEIVTYGGIAVCKIRYVNGIKWQGTGFLFNHSPWIFTCKHVVEDDEFPRSLTEDLKFLWCEFRVGSDIIRFAFSDFEDFKSEKAGDMDFAMIKLKTGVAYDYLTRASRGKYEGECPLSFSVHAEPIETKFSDKEAELDFCFVGYPNGREAEQGPIVVNDRRPIHTDTEFDRGFVYIQDFWVKEGLSGSPVWCKLSTDLPDRWTLVGMISDGAESSPDVAGLGHGPSVIDECNERFTTGFVMKDKGMLFEMQKHIKKNL